MDKLQACAAAFVKLMDIKYHIVIGRKGKAVNIGLGFEAVDFHHLMGLHKLKDIEALSGKREKVFRDILSGHILLSSIEKSLYFKQIERRIEPFTDLEKILDDNRLVFKYNEKAHSFSLIQAEYLLSTPYKANEIYIFLDKKDVDGQFFCRSFFPKENKDYTIGQPTYTLLFKEKTTVSTGEKVVQYDRLSLSHKKAEIVTPSVVQAEPVRQSMQERIAAAQAEAERRNSTRAADQPRPARKQELEK